MDVWLKSDAAAIIGVPATDLDRAVRRVLSVWTEQSGSKLKLNYRGTSSANDIIAGAIYIKGTARTPQTCTSAGMTANLPYDSSTGEHTYATIDIFDMAKQGDPPTCEDIDWRTDLEAAELPVASFDLLTALTHEIGHVAFDLAHSDVCASPSIISVMQSAYPTHIASRVPRDWDQVMSQEAGQRRSQASSTLTGRQWSSASNSWQFTASFASSQRHRPGSLTQNYALTVLPINRKPSTSGGPNDRLQGYRWNGSAFTDYGTLALSIPQRPVSAAVRPATGETLVGYLRKTGPAFTSDSGNFCYKRSLDAGATYGAETCTNLFWTVRYGVTMSYDPASNVFIASIATSPGQLYFYTIPASGSATPSAFTLLEAYSWHAPSIACRNASYGCRIAFEDRTLNGCLKWIEARVNSSTGQIEPLVTRSQCWLMYDTPSVAYDETGGLYWLAFQQGNGAAYSRSMTTTGTSWTGRPDIWNDPATAITSPVLATERFCFFGCTGNVRSWTLRFH